MTDDEILSILKVDLQLSTNSIDNYLFALIEAAKSYINTEGIYIDYNNVGDSYLVVMYAAYLFRKRRETNIRMPRMLRWALNNRSLIDKEGG